MEKTRTAFAWATVYLLFGAAVYLLRPAPMSLMTIFGDTLPVLAAAFAVVATFIVASRYGRGEPHRLIWALLGLGLFMWWLGEAGWWFLEVALGREAPFPSAADIFWLLGYIPLFIGFLLNYRQLDLKLKVRAIWPWLALLALVTLSAVIFIFLPVASSNLSAMEKFLDFLYPIEDILILGTAFLTLTGLSYGVLSRPWKIIAGGFIMILVADLVYAYLSFAGLYRTGNPIDLAWVAGYLAIGVGAVYQLEIGA